jgi:hypothetical protein
MLRSFGRRRPDLLAAAVLVDKVAPLARAPPWPRRRWSSSSCISTGAARSLAPIAATGQALSGDLDGNGRVDILDALVLARKVDAKAPPRAGDDVNWRRRGRPARRRRNCRQGGRGQCARD